MKKTKDENMDKAAFLKRHSQAKDENTAFWTAVCFGDTDEVSKFLEKGVSDDLKNVALVDASYFSEMAVVALLLENGADVHSQNEDGKTALIVASEHDDKELVAFLLEKGADVHATDNLGRTALSYAEEGASSELVALLKKAGAKKLV